MYLHDSASSLSPDDEYSAEDASTIYLLDATISGVRTVHHNVQGIQSKIIDLTQWFKACAGTATIFCFTETWLKPCSTKLTVPGYTVFISPLLHHPGKNGGYLPGSCIIVSNSITIEWSSVCEHLENSAVGESCFFFIYCHKRAKLCVVSVYRAPSTDLWAGLVELRSVVSKLLFYCQHIKR